MVGFNGRCAYESKQEWVLNWKINVVVYFKTK